MLIRNDELDFRRWEDGMLPKLYLLNGMIWVWVLKCIIYLEWTRWFMNYRFIVWAFSWCWYKSFEGVEWRYDVGILCLNWNSFRIALSGLFLDVGRCFECWMIQQVVDWRIIHFHLLFGLFLEPIYRLVVLQNWKVWAKRASKTHIL